MALNFGYSPDYSDSDDEYNGYHRGGDRGSGYYDNRGTDGGSYEGYGRGGYHDSRGTLHESNHGYYDNGQNFRNRYEYQPRHDNGYDAAAMMSQNKRGYDASGGRNYRYHRNSDEYRKQRQEYTSGNSRADPYMDPGMEPDYDDSDDNDAVAMGDLAPQSRPGYRERQQRGHAGNRSAVTVADVHIENETFEANSRDTGEQTTSFSANVSSEKLAASETKASAIDSISDSDTDSESSWSAPPFDPELVSLKTLDLAKTIRLRLRTKRKRDPVLHPQDIHKSTVKNVEYAHIAQQFIKLYRAHVAQGRDQLLSQQTKDLTGIEKYKYQSSKKIQKTRTRVGQLFSSVEIWRGAFKTVEGNFGSSIVAYFRFVKWLFLMNLLTFVMILTVIVLPQELMRPDTFNDTMEGINKDDNPGHFEYNSEALECSANYTQSLDDILDGQSIGLDILDFFLGTGWMEETLLFAGYYFNKTMYYELEESEENEEDPQYGVLNYNMPLAYLLCTAFYFVTILILMVNYTGKGVRDRLVNSGDKFNHTCNMVFCGWDYNLTTEKAANLKHKNLFNELQNDMAEARREEERKNMSFGKRLCLFIIRLFIWAFVLLVWGGSFYLIVMVVGTWVPDLLRQENVQDNWILLLVVEILPSLTITAINVVAAPLFQIIVQFEDYTPETEVRITIARTVILRLASIGVLSFTLHSRITDCNDDEYQCGNCPGIECWETYVGQEYYKLVVVDFFVIVGVTFFVEFPRRLVVKKFPNNFVMSKVGQQEFELPKNVLEIVYTQTISWIGGFFAPLIPAITVIKLFIFFYVKKLTLMQNCIPAAKPYRASKSNYFFMIILMISYALCVIIICYAIGRIPPSQSCGPWRVYSQDDYYLYTAVTDTITLLPEGIETVLNIVTNWVLYVLLLIILCLIIYYYQAIASGNKRKVELLKEQLALEGMDKQFLLKQVNQVLQRTAAQQID